MAEKDIYEQFKNSLDESTLTVSDENFKLPDMGEFYNTAVDDPYIKMVDEAIRNVENGDVNKASFYVEEPYTTKLGSYDLEGVYFIKAKPDISETAEATGYFDGDTLYFPKSSMQADNETITRITNSLDSAISDLKKQNGENAGKLENVGVRFLGVNTPETPKFHIEMVDLDDETTTSLPWDTVKSYDKKMYIINRGAHKSGDIVHLIKVDNIWQEYVEAEASDEEKEYMKKKGLNKKIKVLYKEGESDPDKLAAGLKAKTLVKDLVTKAGGEVYFMIDRTSLNRSSDHYPGEFGVDAFSTGVVQKFFYWWQQIVDYNPYKYAGYNLWGQDSYGRYLGTPYVKITDSTGTKWINLAKYVIANVPEVEVLPDYTGSPLLQDNYAFASKVFKLHTYDYKNRVLADAVGILSDMLDDRRKIQRDIFGRDFDALKDWTVTIGDVTLFVPPTSIRSVVNTTHERIPTVRSRGSITKGALKEERMLEMTIYFNDERGINGFEYEAELPDKTKTTYYMNGLRALISQFKFTPFLPIESHYINEVLNVDAVTLVNLQISTLPDYPKCIAAVLTLQEFDYMQYMPELPVDTDNTDAYRNTFAATINYSVMRWYYQRALQLGQELKDVDVNSKAYLEKTYGSKTALIPMNFSNPNIRFLIANEEHLKKMLQVKMDSIRRSNAKIILSDVEKEVAKDVAQVYVQLSNMLGSQEYKDALDTLLKVGENQAIGVEKTEDTEGEGKLEKTGLGLYNGANDMYAKDKNGDLTGRANDFLKAISLEMMKANDTAGKTILTGAKFVYKEKDIEKINYDAYGEFLENESRKYDEDGHYIHDESKWKPEKAKYVKGSVVLGVEFTVQLDYLTNPDSQISDLIKDAELSTQITLKDVFKDKKIFVPFEGTFERNENDDLLSPYVMDKESYKFKLDTMNKDIQFIAYCYSIATQLGLTDNKTMNEEALDLKQYSDMDSMETLVYEDYDIGDVRIKNLSAGFGNVFTRVSLNGTSGYAPQYMGGQDTIIEVNLETTDLYSVGLLSALPRITTQYARDYRLILPASPLKLDSEITKLLGVNEVVIENLNIDTVPNQPGLYNISMRLVSMDRTLRNREGLKKINEFAISGNNGMAEQTEMQLQTYFELGKALARAELYPDLELPTLEELESHNFVFIRHKFEEGRVYPDPDFYFVYGHVLQSQIFREAIENAAQEGFGEMKWVDKEGGEVTTNTYKKMGVKIDDANEESKDRDSKFKQMLKINLKMPDEKKKKKSGLDVINALRAADITNTWNISDDIKTIFLEPAYLSLLENYNQLSSAPSEKDNLDSSAGVWVHDAMKPAREASKKIEEYLSKPPMPPMDYLYVYGAGYATTFSEVAPHEKDDADKKIDQLLSDKSISKIFELLEIKVDKKFKKALKNIVYAAACAATSEKEFTGKKKEAAWKPNKNFIGMRVTNAQDQAGKSPATSAEEVVKYGIEFGPYRIKMYTKEELKEITNETVPDGIFGDKKDTEDMNTSYFLLDPYYRRKETTVAEVEYYKESCVGNLPYATEAFFRLMLFWLKRMIDDNILPNMSLDVLKGEMQTELTSAAVEKYVNKEADEELLEMQKYLEFLDKSDRAIDGGKMFATAVMAMTNSDAFYEPMKNRRYDMLNGMVESSLNGSGDYNPTDMDYILLRKFLLALVGLEEIKKETDIGKQADNPITDFKKELNEKKYIDAAEDPSQYVKHSFFDMIVNDRRGRMCRAFPTFYVVFVDEGREVGLWKLHDNFYNINAISEIQVAKSRKNPADTCRIVLSNLFHTLTTEDEDSNMTYEADYRDVFTSIFNPRSYYMKEEAKRMKQQPLNRAKLTAGTRIHVRMGYGSNAATLPVAFNGMIAEVSAGDLVEIVAQGDGVELLNPILDQTEAHKKKNEDKNPISKFFQNLFSNAATPKTIIDAFLTVEGGWVEKKIRDWTNGYYFNDHPLGITHFGNPKYNVVFKAGESTQNIFEALNKPAWSGEDSPLTKEWAMDEVPKFTIDVFGKTFWDILNICGSASPDFIVGVAPFGFRSTIFHGHPRYYYAYEYYQDTDGTILERRKPYQQFHIYTSFSDIIKNDIKASASEIKTNAIGMYKLQTIGTKENQEKVGPLWVDWDIYPEHQKSMTVDTQLLAKGMPVIGSIVPFLDWIIDKVADDKGVVQSGKQVAWRMTAHALKQSMHDMYQGEMIVVGDPSVKPHDRFYLYDIYENMSGSALVEGVVHNFSADNGFTTTLYPDLVAAVDDRHELAIQSIAGNIVSKSMMAYIATLMPSMLYGRSFTPLLTMAAKQSRSILYGASKLTKAVGAEKTTKRIVKAAQTAKKVAKTGKIAAAGATAAGAVAASGGTALVPLLAVGIEMAVVHTLTSLADAAIQRWMASKQVLQVFPLKKNQTVLTAGMNGSKGVVYGSPTYDMKGVMDTLFTKLNTETNGFGTAVNFVIDMLATDEMKAIAMKYERGENMSEQVGSTVSGEKASDKLLATLAANQSRTQSGYHRLLLTPRIKPQDEDYGEKLTKAFENMAFLDTNGIEIQHRITNEMIYVKLDPKLKELMGTGFLQTAWDSNLPENTYESKEFNINGKKTQIRTIVVEHKGKKLYDIPFLHPDALAVLREIMIKSTYLIPEDEPEKEKTTPENFIMLHSALKVGDSETFSSLGVSFILEAHGEKKKTVLLDAVKAIENETEELYNEGQLTNKKLFEWSTDKNGSGEDTMLLVTVYPPEATK